MKTSCTILFAVLFSLSQAQNYAGGDGSQQNPYQIANGSDLIYLSQNTGDWSAFFLQIADIIFEDIPTQTDWNDDGLVEPNGADSSGFIPIGRFFNGVPDGFKGLYDGDKHIIKNLYVNGESFSALFGYVSGARIYNLGLENTSIFGTYQTAALIGCCEPNFEISQLSHIKNCYTSGHVSGKMEAGGLVGWNMGCCIEACYSSCHVTAEEMGGGLVGHSSQASAKAIVKNCYSTGQVSREIGSDTTTAAFCGSSDGTVFTNSYTTGNVFYSDGDLDNKGFISKTSENDSYNNNFFDSELSNQNSALGAEALLSAAMKQSSTYTNAGWDFMDESANGDAEVWGINPNDNNAYPFLSWQGYNNGISTSNFEAIKAPNVIFNRASQCIIIEGVKAFYIYNINGERVLSSKNNFISLASLPSGVYILCGEHISQKFIW